MQRQLRRLGPAFVGAAFGLLLTSVDLEIVLGSDRRIPPAAWPFVGALLGFLYLAAADRFSLELPKLVSVALLLAALVITILFSLWNPRYFYTPRIDVASYEKITIGMTYREVVRLMGGPPGNYGDTIPPPQVWSPFVVTENGPPASVHGWIGTEIAILVYCDANGRVIAKSGFYPAVRQRSRESFMDGLLRWLGFPRERVMDG